MVANTELGIFSSVVMGLVFIADVIRVIHSDTDAILCNKNCPSGDYCLRYTWIFNAELPDIGGEIQLWKCVLLGRIDTDFCP